MADYRALYEAEAAEVIELNKENDRLRAALSKIADGDAFFDGAKKFMQIAREALTD
jgi:hypothetical protein